MADGVNTAVKEVESAETHAVVNGALAHTELDQLRPSHHPPLPLRELADRSLPITRLSLTLYFNVKVGVVGHAGKGGAAGVAGGL